MVGSSKERLFGRASQVPLTLELTNWPLRDEAPRAWLTLVVFAALGLGAGIGANSTAMGLLAFCALAAASWRLWIPVHFEFGSKGIEQRVLWRRRRIPWGEFARSEVRRDGVLLLTDRQASPLAALRGLFIRWNHKRQPLLEIIEFFLDSRVKSAASTRSFQH
jgi:hypothetical protein